MAQFPRLLMPGGTQRAKAYAQVKRNRRQRRNWMDKWPELDTPTEGWRAIGGATINDGETFTTATQLNSGLRFDFSTLGDDRKVYIPGSSHGKEFEFSVYLELQSLSAGVEPYPFKVSYFDSGQSFETVRQEADLSIGVPQFFKIRFKFLTTDAEGGLHGRIRMRSNDAAEAGTLKAWRWNLVEVFERQGG